MTDMCIAAANYLIEKTNEYNAVPGRKFVDTISMTCKRLQKLLYFSEVVYMKRHGGLPMLKDDFCAWPSGPVIPSVYYKFQHFQGGKMEILPEVHTPLTREEKAVLDFVFEQTKEMDTLDLVEISHKKGGPWDKVFDENDLNYSAIVEKNESYMYYKDIKEETIFAI